MRVPPVIGRMVGPLFGGAIVTVTSWRWIFFINIPFGLLAIAMAWLFIRDQHALDKQTPFDGRGFFLLALALVGLLGAFETVGKDLVSGWVIVLGAVLGLLAFWHYLGHARRSEHPLIDLRILRLSTFRTNVLGGALLRVAIGAAPFLLPLMLQLGFGLSPLVSGTITVATAVGALSTRFVLRRLIGWLGFKQLLIGASVITSLFYMSYSLFTPNTPLALMFAMLMLGGLVNSMCLVSLGTLGFSEIPKSRMSHATTLSTMSQQLSISVWVVLGASLVHFTSWWLGHDSSTPQAEDFSPAFVAIGMLTLLSVLSFRTLRADAGADMR